MIFTKNDLRLVSIKVVQAKEENKTYTFVKLADKATFDTNEFMLAKECDSTNLSSGNDYTVDLVVDGRFTSVFLFPLKADKGNTSNVK